ncbi:hypothetical protein [Bacillus sp. EAC]|uniref:hypothetical protein n=1 Tax=Bacillus sp. EAC TaxID=1978338 RepID=UPI000B43193A|nr:hypothetical protein [Bacillus sp. EAC]
MKKVIPALVVASTILTSQALPGLHDSVSAATKVTSVKYVTAKKQISIDGSLRNIATIKHGSKTLYSLKDVSSALKITTIFNKKNNTTEFKVVSGKNKTSLLFNSKSKAILLNNKKFSMTIVNNKGVLYGDVNVFASTFGKEVLKAENTSTVYISSTKLLQADTYETQFIAGGKLLVTGDTEEASNSYIVNPMTMKIEKTLPYQDLTVSNDGKSAVYVDDEGIINIVDLNTAKVSKFDQNVEPKTSVIWSTDNKKIYYIEGDKNASISELDLTSGAFKVLVADKVENKSDLIVASVSPLKFIYNVTKTATSTIDPITGEQTEIDDSNAGQDLWSIDASVSGATAVQLTNSKDNKVYPTILPSGFYSYLSQSTEDENALEKLIVQNPLTNQAMHLYAGKDFSLMTKTMDGKVLVVQMLASGDQVFELTESGMLKPIFKSVKRINSLTALNTAKLAFTYGDDGEEKTAYVTNGTVTYITK